MSPNNIPAAIHSFISSAIEEDIGEADHTTAACIDATAQNRAQLIAQEEGIIAGIEAAQWVFHKIDPDLSVTPHKKEGTPIREGQSILEVEGATTSILQAERLVLNFMQRMSGIATLTHRYVKEIQNTGATLLDTRKTTPSFRYFEKWAVKIGGGENHRMGLYDVIMIKDNHIDYCGGIIEAIKAVHSYLHQHGKNLPIIIEARNFEEINKVFEAPPVQRILIDNFSPSNLKEAVELIDNYCATEASGNITLENIYSYAKTGVEYISVGAITHSAPIIDLSLKPASS